MTNVRATTAIVPPEADEIPFDYAEAMRQIGTMNILATSGGRVIVERQDGQTVRITLPVRYGYSVEVTLSCMDTYTVRRVFTRAGRRTVKEQMTDLYFDDLSEAVYSASCYHHPMKEVFTR